MKKNFFCCVDLLVRYLFPYPQKQIRGILALALVFCLTNPENSFAQEYDYNDGSCYDHPMFSEGWLKQLAKGTMNMREIQTKVVNSTPFIFIGYVEKNTPDGFGSAAAVLRITHILKGGDKLKLGTVLLRYMDRKPWGLSLTKGEDGVFFCRAVDGEMEHSLDNPLVLNFEMNCQPGYGASFVKYFAPTICFLEHQYEAVYGEIEEKHLEERTKDVIFKGLYDFYKWLSGFEGVHIPKDVYEAALKYDEHEYNDRLERNTLFPWEKKHGKIDTTIIVK